MNDNQKAKEWVESISSRMNYEPVAGHKNELRHSRFHSVTEDIKTGPYEIKNENGIFVLYDTRTGLEIAKFGSQSNAIDYINNTLNASDTMTGGY